MFALIDIVIAMFLTLLFGIVFVFNILIKNEHDEKHDVTHIIDYAEFLYINIELVSKNIQKETQIEINHSRNLITFINNDLVNFTISKVSDGVFRVVCEGIVLQKEYKTKVTENQYNKIEDALYVLGLHKEDGKWQ